MAEGQQHVSSPPELKPNPDPTDRTIEQIRRETAMLREILETRLDGYDKAIGLIQAQVDREPKPPVLAELVKNVSTTLIKLEENINLRFVERDKRNEQMVRDSKALVDTTIAAMKDAFTEQTRTSQAAIGKSETSISKQMDQIESKFGTEIKALTGNITDVKDDVTRLKSMRDGGKEQREDTKEKWGYLVGAIGIISTIITVMFLVSNNTSKIENIRFEQPRIDAPRTQP